MAIKTTEQLLAKVDYEISWRRKEIHDLKTIAHSSHVSDLRKKVLYRTGVALLYAHWEGFIKYTGTYYLEFVSYQRLPINELKNNFVTLIYKNKINESVCSNKFSIFDSITDILINENTKIVKVPYVNIINTQSNLSSKVLKEILWCLGIEYSLFATKEHLIDSRLVNKRNHIAHGEEIAITRDDFIEIVDNILEIIVLFKDELENSAVLKKYKKLTIASS